jgi:long-subunit acyl-CoA synthetase (AMP-forming)
VPELLKVMLAASLQGWKSPDSLQFIAVGGAKVSSLSIHQARHYGLPVYQGYGLSECGSVVSLAQAGDPLGGCGKLLEHVNARVMGNELMESGNIFLGYLGEPSTWYQQEFATGDYVSLDHDQLFITGRKKLQIINSFGRNISPEWAESLITANPLVHQCMVVGEAQPYCVALVSAMSDALSQNMLDAYLAQINLQLPDYAKVRKAILLKSPLTFEQGLLTANGRIKREQTANMFAHEIDLLYERDMDYPHAPDKISHL